MPIKFNPFTGKLDLVNEEGTGGVTLTFSDTNTINLTLSGSDVTADLLYIDSDTINFSDSGSGFTGAVITQMSLTSDGSGVKLVNDESAPGNSEYYGTDSGGTKGFFPLPIDFITAVSDTNTIDLVITGTTLSANLLYVDSATINFSDSGSGFTGITIQQMSITADASGLKLDGDASSPGNDKYYGTDSGGTKGFFDLPTGSGGGYDTIEEEGTPLTQRTTLNFVGGGITAADDTTRTNVTLDATLNALAAYNTNGLIAQTAADTFAGRTITGPAAGITVSNGDGVAGNPTLALANDLSALEGLASTGFAVRSAADTWVQRSIAVSTGLTIANGDGVAANPTITNNALGAKRIMCEIIHFVEEGQEPTAGMFTPSTSPATPTDAFIPYFEMAAGNRFGAKAVLPDSYVTGTALFLRVTYGATVSSGSMSATLDGVSAVLDTTNNNTFSANMAHHNNDASVSLTVSAANTNKVFADATFEVTNSSGVFDDGSDTDVTAAAGMVVTVTVERTDADTEGLRIYSVEIIWA